MPDLLESVIKIAYVAGEEVMKIYGSDDFGTELKSDSSPLTKADMASHHTIIAGLQDLDTGYPVISEEDREKTPQEHDIFWLVDPLDGTKEFVKRNGEFTVNIGLIKNGRPVLGVVYAPVLETLYAGEESRGAFKIKEGERTRIKSEFNGDIPKVLASRTHRDENIEKFLKNLGEYEEASVGSSLKFCMIAEGAAMLYPRLAPMHEWDTAAADAVVRAAGGRVQDISGNDLTYTTTELLNLYFVVSAANSIDWQPFLPDLN